MPFKKLYTYASTADTAMMVVGCVAATASGTILPLFSLVFGKALNILNDSTAQIVDSISTLALYFLLIAIGAGLLSFMEVSVVSMATERQVSRYTPECTYSGHGRLDHGGRRGRDASRQRRVVTSGTRTSPP